MIGLGSNTDSTSRWSGPPAETEQQVSYNITFYCHSNATRPGEAIDQIAAWTASQGVGLQLATRASGVGWAEASIGLSDSSAADGSVRLEVHNAPSLVGDMVKQVSSEDSSKRLAAADLVAILTLSGDEIEWEAVRGTWLALEALWSAIPYDDGSGFGATIESLG